MLNTVDCHHDTLVLIVSARSDVDVSVELIWWLG
jgi:hypothetical protein